MAPQMALRVSQFAVLLLLLSTPSYFLELPGCNEVCNMYPPCYDACVDRCGCCTTICPVLGYRRICAQSDGNGVISLVGRCYFGLICHPEELTCLPMPQIPLNLDQTHVRRKRFADYIKQE